MFNFKINNRPAIVQVSISSGTDSNMWHRWHASHKDDATYNVWGSIFPALDCDHPDNNWVSNERRTIGWWLSWMVWAVETPRECVCYALRNRRTVGVQVGTVYWMTIVAWLKDSKEPQSDWKIQKDLVIPKTRKTPRTEGSKDLQKNRKT
jgi:hypothetical protein